LESGSLWALVGTGLALQAGGLGVEATVYLGTSALILAVAVVETSYLMAYHDELTGLPGRRAFNELLLGLEHQYAIAIVDVDHFKRFNDTYGHETGDEVLRMVASRLSAVTGGGKAFRCGGEEFAIVFAEKSAAEAIEHLESLRMVIQGSAFKVRGQLDRRKLARGADDRRQAPKKKPKNLTLRPADDVSVTVSIGVAEPSTRNRKVDQVISAADKALYRAKESGRNRVELDGSPRKLRAAANSHP
jgi:diguanylate cyclase (GGDEF)-like protein